MIAVVFGVICALIASHKGRNAVGWFFLGFFFSCISLIILLCLSNLAEEKARWDQSQNEQRRLREQLRQERMKNEAFQGHVRARLDVHDQALGMDSRQIEAPATAAALPAIEGPGEAPGDMPAAAERAPAASSAGGLCAEVPFDQLQWFVKYGDRTSQPLAFPRLKKIYASGYINERTYVRSSAMTEWKQVLEIPGLLEALL